MSNRRNNADDLLSSFHSSTFRSRSPIRRISATAATPASVVTAQSSLARSPLATTVPSVPAATADVQESNAKLCRICLDSGNDEKNQPVMENQLCNCRGSVGCVHASCVTNWLRRSLQLHCELCNAAYPLWVVPERALDAQLERDLDRLRRRQQSEVRDLIVQHEMQLEQRGIERRERRWGHQTVPHRASPRIQARDTERRV